MITGSREPGCEDALHTLTTVAADLGLDPGQTVLAWPTHRPTPILPVVGVSRPDQLDSALTAINAHIPTETVNALEHARRQVR